MNSRLIVVPALSIAAALGGYSVVRILVHDIYGIGEIAQKDEFPWQVALEFRMPGDALWHSCGGAIYSDKWILTAAHCAGHDPPDPNVFVVLAGSKKLQHLKFGCTPPRNCVRRFLQHESFDGHPPAPWKDDIALLELCTPLRLGESIAPIELASEQEDSSFKEAPIAGWGCTKKMNVLGIEIELNCKDLRYIKMNSYDRATCSSLYNGVITDSMTCAESSTGGGVDIRDSGGGLTLGTLQGTKLLGLASSQKADYPDVFTRVSKYAGWISDCVDHGNCPPATVGKCKQG